MKHHRTEFSTYALIVLLGASITFMKTCTNEAGTTFIDVRKLDNSFDSIVVEGQGYFPVILGLPTNEGVVVLLGGAPHIGINGRLDIVRSKDSGVTWSAPVRITETKEHPPDMVKLSDGTILLIFGVRHQPYSVQGMISRDNGHTWLKKRLLFADDLPGTDIGYPSTVRLTNGKLITVYYRAGSKADHRDGTNPACLAICHDEKTLLKALKNVD